MYVYAVVVEQLEPDGHIRTLTMRPEGGRPLVISFGNEYDEPRNGPFHFLDETHENTFREAFANCRTRQLSTDSFQSEGPICTFSTSWIGIPTEQRTFTYYALSLPEYAVPMSIEVTDPHVHGRNYKKSVYRDDTRGRFVVYVECRSSRGRFDFNLRVTFELRDKEGYYAGAYSDAFTDHHAHQIDDYRHAVGSDEAHQIQNYFTGNILVGGQLTETETTIHTERVELLTLLDDGQLVGELLKTKAALLRNGDDNNQAKAAEQVDLAVTALTSRQKDQALSHLKSAGKWALDAATQVAAGFAVEVLKRTVGM